MFLNNKFVAYVISIMIVIFLFCLDFVLARAVYSISIQEFHLPILAFILGICSFFGIPVLIIYSLDARDKSKEFMRLQKQYEKLNKQYTILKENIPKYEQEAIHRNEIIAELNKHKLKLEQEHSKKINFLKEQNWHLQKLNNVINTKIKDIPILISIWKEIEYNKQNIILKYLEKKLYAETKIINEVTRLLQEKQFWLLKAKELSYKCALYESIVPSLPDFIDDEVTKEMTIYRIIKNEYSIDENEHFSLDEARQYLTEQEYCTLSDTEKYQKALENWYYHRLKTKTIVRKDFEQYIKYYMEQLGFTVSYFKDNNLHDMGNILVCYNHDKIYIVQCKCWNSKKQIHENEITQLLGITLQYCIELINDAELEIDSIANGYISPYALISDGKVIPFLVTTTTLTKSAQNFAKSLEITFHENMLLKLYPMIKCFKKGNNNLYLLPFDKLYKNIDVAKYNGFMALTTKEAEQAGFKRGLPYMF